MDTDAKTTVCGCTTVELLANSNKLTEKNNKPFLSSRLNAIQTLETRDGLENLTLDILISLSMQADRRVPPISYMGLSQ